MRIKSNNQMKLCLFYSPMRMHKMSSEGSVGNFLNTEATACERWQWWDEAGIVGVLVVVYRELHTQDLKSTRTPSDQNLTTLLIPVESFHSPSSVSFTPALLEERGMPLTWRTTSRQLNVERERVRKNLWEIVSSNESNQRLVQLNWQGKRTRRLHYVTKRKAGWCEFLQCLVCLWCVRVCDSQS